MSKLEELSEGIWRVDSGRGGPSVAVSFGVHGNERPPIDAGLALVDQFRSGELELEAGSLLLIHANPRGSAQDQRWSEGGIDLNRCFHRDVLARAPEVYEEEQAREIVSCLEAHRVQVLVDFHCTVEPGERFLMHHPAVSEPAHREVVELLQAEVLLADPQLNFGSVSLDEWMSTRDRVGICYETGWIQDPANTPEAVLGEMRNVLLGQGLVAGEARRYGSKKLLQLDGFLPCAKEGFRWTEGIGVNLQDVAAGTVLGRYGDGSEEKVERGVTLIFPKKKPEMVQLGKPLVYLARRMD